MATVMARPGDPQVNQYEPGSHHSVARGMRRDGHAWIPPVLAFNLGLEYELAPLMCGAHCQSDSAAQLTTCSECTPVGAIMVSKQAACPLMTHSQEAHGRPCPAKELWLAKIRTPAIRTDEGEADAFIGPEENSDESERRALPSIQPGADNESVALVAIRDGLQDYFHGKQRCDSGNYSLSAPPYCCVCCECQPDRSDAIGQAFGNWGRSGSAHC